MLSIGKLAPGSQEYYLRSVARGVEDYYLGAGEAPGRWLGTGAAGLGLSGRVTEADFRAVMAGHDPRTGEDLLRGRPGARRVPGYDLTFSAPKSVSLVFALGDERARREVTAAHDAAVAATMEHYVALEAILARRGAGGYERIGTTGPIAAAFRHRTSRAGDPALHTHVLLANLVEGDDRRWSSLDGGPLYTHAKAAGYLYQAQLRRELTERLGVAWTAVLRGAAEIAGTPRTAIEGFSRRAAEIAASLAERGEHGMRASHVAAFDTRKRKVYEVDGDALHDRWAARGAALGFTRDHVMARLHIESAAPVTTPMRQAISVGLASKDGLTAKAASFDRREVVMALAEQLSQGARVEEVTHWSDQFLASNHAIPLADAATAQVFDGAARPGRRGDRRYSTPEMLAVEDRVVRSAVARHREGSGVASPAAIDAALEARPALTDEQRTLVRRLTRSGAGVEVVAAVAGAGKTFSLDAARAAWEASGFRVIGAGVAARYAAELEAGAGIESYTVDRLLLDLAHPVHGGFRADTVLVVDEANTLGTRRLAALLGFAEAARTKVVLAGDPHQLAPIGAGGAFEGIARRLGAIELTANLRQREAWERNAVAELRSGDVGVALAAYTDHGRVSVMDNAPAAHAQLIEDYFAARQAGQSVAMFAPRNLQVDQLNAIARARMAEVGMLRGDALVVGGRPFQVGDRVMPTRNLNRHGIKNGVRGEVVAIDHDRGELRYRTDGGVDHTLPADYLAAGHLAHAYASTVHKVEGMTVDAAFFLGDNTVYRELAYTGITRGTVDNRWYVVASERILADDLDVPEQERRDPLVELARSLRRSGAKELAVDHLGELGLAGHSLADLYAEQELIRQRLDAGPPDASELIEAVAERRRQAEASLAGARGQLARLDAGGRRRRGSASTSVERTRTAVRDWERRVSDLDAELATLGRKQRQRDAFIAEHTGELQQYVALGEAIGGRMRRHLSQLEAGPPSYVTDVLGPRPRGPVERRLWRQGLAAIESYRARFAVRDAERPLGPEPRGRVARTEYRVAGLAVEAAVDRLTTSRAAEHTAPIGDTPRT